MVFRFMRHHRNGRGGTLAVHVNNYFKIVSFGISAGRLSLGCDMKPPNRILHVDGDSFFASCEIALNPQLQEQPVWVGGGRRGDGIVIAANRLAKKFGITTGMACFEAKRLCPMGVLCPPHYDEYRRLSLAMFRILEDCAPVIVPMSIDEGFLDLTTMSQHVWRDTTAMHYMQGIGERIRKEVGLPVSGGLASSSRLAKLATDAAKPGFMEVPTGYEQEFLKDRPVRELSGIGKNRQRSLAALGALTFGHVAKLPSMLLRQKFGIWGQQLWLFANGQWNEREISLAIRFNDFTELATSHRYRHPQFLNSVINTTLEAMFREIMPHAFRPVRQIRIAMFNLERLDTQPTLWGTTDAERWGAVDEAADKLKEQLGKAVLITGAQLALRKRDAAHVTPKAKCPFTPQREMVQNLWGA